MTRIVAPLAGRLLPRSAAAALVAAAALAGLPGAAAGQAAEIRSTRAGVYTEEQAARGKITVDTLCSRCHNPTNPLSGTRITTAFAGRPLYVLWDYITVNMPQSAPGTLPQQQYADVLAYLLKLNGLPAGGDELPPDPVAISNIDFDPPLRPGSQ